MSARAFWEDFQARWHALAGWLWPPTPADLARAEVARRTAELTARYEALVQRRRRLEHLRGLLARSQVRIDQLTSTIAARFQRGEGETAWRLALRLDRVRQKRDGLQARVAARERAYEVRRVAFVALKRELQQLQVRGSVRK